MKRFIAFITVTLMLLSLVGCAKQNLQFEIENVTKISVFSGSTGKSVEITDEETIAHITDNINSLTFVKNKSSKNYNGFTYSITWYDADNEKTYALTIMGKNAISYDDYFYNISDSNTSIDVEYIDSLFSDLTE